MHWPATKSCRPAVRPADATGSATSPRLIFRVNAPPAPRRRLTSTHPSARSPATSSTPKSTAPRRAMPAAASSRRSTARATAGPRRCRAARGRALDTRDDKFALARARVSARRRLRRRSARASRRGAARARIRGARAGDLPVHARTRRRGSLRDGRRAAANGRRHVVARAVSRSALRTRRRGGRHADVRRRCRRPARDATVIATRRGVVERGGTLAFAVADLGGGLSLDRVRITAAGRDARIDVGGIFFADGDQHVDLETETRHDSPETRSVTVVRTAATGARPGALPRQHPYRRARATRSDASLRDDALLLGRKRAHRVDPGARDRDRTTSRRSTARPSARSTTTRFSTPRAAASRAPRPSG